MYDNCVEESKAASISIRILLSFSDCTKWCGEVLARRKCSIAANTIWGLKKHENGFFLENVCPDIVNLLEFIEANATF